MDNGRRSKGDVISPRGWVMRWTNPSLYLVGAVLTLGPLGLRVLTWPSGQKHDLDPNAVAEGKKLFLHEWQVNDPLCPNGDGLGPVFNANSCVACHRQGGVGGAGGLEHNVTTFNVEPNRPGQQPREGVLHANAINPKYQENLRHIAAELQPTVRPTLEDLKKIAQQGGTVHLSQRNTPALFGAKLIDELPDRVIVAMEKSQRVRWGMAGADTREVPVGRANRMPDGRVGKFGWKAHSASLFDFVQAACANEIGLGNPGQNQPTPLSEPAYLARGLDLTQQQCEQMTAFVASLHRPVQRMPNAPDDCRRVENGKELFLKIGCADCHTPNVGSIEGIYSDLLLHRMGEELKSQGLGSYFERPQRRPNSPGEGPLPDEWRTPPLWGVADSAPYMHDGRATTLEKAIEMHGGQSRHAAQRFQSLTDTERASVIAFLKSLRAP